ncbi:MAG TPA: putative glycoside hydrolase, partial [Puia sp.]|nr:putative glycoside hydrolase [Puia sp.]
AQLSQNGKFPAVAHNSGDYARSVAYAWSQDFMAFNMSSGCPASGINPSLGSHQTYNQFIAAFWAAKIANDPLYANLDGLFLDNFVDIPSQLISNASRVDYLNQNAATPSPDNANAWKAGMADLAHQVRLSLPHKIVIANTGGNVTNTGAYLNGGMIEGVDQNGKNTFVGDANGDPTAFYDSWINGGTAPQVFVYNASDATTSGVDAARTDYRAMRFLLTRTMLNNGYFDYDEFLVSNPSAGLNSGGHQTTWWYDEFDNAGQGTGYLGYPLSVATQPITGVFRRDFEKGICLCNTTTVSQTISLGKKYQKINGTQDHATNDGSQVTVITLPPGDGIILLSIF